MPAGDIEGVGGTEGDREESESLTKSMETLWGRLPSVQVLLLSCSFWAKILRNNRFLS